MLLFLPLKIPIISIIIEFFRANRLYLNALPCSKEASSKQGRR